MTAFTFGTPNSVPMCSYKQYVHWLRSALPKALTLAMTVHQPTGIYILCFSWELHILSLSCRQSEKQKICKEFFFRCPTLTSCCSSRRLLPPPLPDLCYRPAWLHFSAEKGYAASSPRFCWAHMTSRRWIWRPLGPRAAVLSKAMKAGLRKTTASEWRQALGA